MRRRSRLPRRARCRRLGLRPDHLRAVRCGRTGRSRPAVPARRRMMRPCRLRHSQIRPRRPWRNAIRRAATRPHGCRRRRRHRH
ncbi:hypothetical protein D7207_16950 [Burkholderia cepacia]|nr:hypothetical protein [Burkholderia cepacia]MBA9945459.1 hypothetical protein [Burkholderia cepacia]MBA9975909.1 hypothetical protein [Burkholderia cepacia]MBA9994106.1 hypothetical protein [Burkholderia cepacia]MBB0002358.1 hypothetical protein [Burkholderia cepacia]